MKHSHFLAASLCAAVLAFASCDRGNTIPFDDDEIESGNNSGNETGDENGNNNPGTTTASLPDCFVYYQGAKFIFKRTLDDGRVTKIVWEVTDYNESTKTATISSKRGDDEPTELKIRKGANGTIEFENYGNWKTLTNGASDIKFLMGYELNSIPSGCYGSIKNKTKLEAVSAPGGKTSQGFSISSEYSSNHDSFMFDYSSGESWCTECGLTSAGYAYRNGKEYPIYVDTWTIELIAYDIPMPDGTRRSYQPAESTIYDVTETNFSCYQNDYSKQRYACIFAYWNDKQNTNVLRYRLCVIWYDNGWVYGQITDDFHTRWSLSCWFAGEPYSATGIGGPYDGVRFDCSGHYSSSTGSQSYSPFDAAGYYTFFVLAENSVNVGEPDLEKTVFSCLYIPNDGSARSTYSDRVRLLDDGTLEYYYESAKSVAAKVRPAVPDPSWIEGPVRMMK